jgi:outer membrane protein assembly factor BamE
MRVLFLSLIAITLVGCSSWGFPGVYRINVEQGNIVTQEMVEQIKPGMTRRQVRYILGTPLLEDSFNRDRWDYLYMLRNGDTILQEDRLSVYFTGDSLDRFESTLLPIEPEPVAQPKEPVQ